MAKTAPSSYPVVQSADTFIGKTIKTATLSTINQQMNHLYKYQTRVLVRENWRYNAMEHDGLTNPQHDKYRPRRSSSAPILVYNICGAKRFKYWDFILDVSSSSGVQFGYRIDINTAGSSITAGGNVATTGWIVVGPGAGGEKTASLGLSTHSADESLDVVVQVNPTAQNVYVDFFQVTESNATLTLP